MQKAIMAEPMPITSDHLPDACFEADRPFFVYDLKIIRENIARLRAILRTQKCENHRLFFSLKSNPNPHLISAMRELVDGFDVSSLIELKMLLRVGIEAARIGVSGPGKTNEFLDFALGSGVDAIHVDSLDEFDYIKSQGVISREHPGPRICLRIADERAAGGKLGLGKADLESILQNPGKISIGGFHAYLGTENFSLPVLSELVKWGEGLRQKYKSVFSADCAYYIGPGLPRPDLIKDDVHLGEMLNSATPMHFECGRAIVGNAGFYVAPVLSVKKNAKRNVVIINGGVQHLNVQLFSRVFGDLGIQSVIFRDGIVLQDERVPTSIYGSLCTDNDILHPNLPMPKDLRRGDWLAVAPCGAYNISASNSQFIGQPMAAEWLIDSGQSSAKNKAKNISPKNFTPYQEAFHE